MKNQDMIKDLIGNVQCQIPTLIGKYKFIRRIGKGSFSVVNLVKSIQDKSLHACKVVSRNVLADLGIFPRFEQEVRLMQSLQHPNIIKLEEVIYEQDYIYLIMEYCSNGDLFQRIIDFGPYIDPTLRSIFRSIVEGISYMHKHNIAHRDLKPENILLDSNMNPKIADFGLCHETNEMKLLTTPCGSPFYAPPEIISNKAYDGKRSDVWSLGVVLYTMATGALPWTEINQSKLFLQIQSADFSIPTELTPPVQQLLLQMLSQNPKDRPTIDQILSNPWLSNDDDLFNLAPTSLNYRKSLNNLSSNDAAMLKLSTKRPLIIRPDKVKKNTSSLKLARFGAMGKIIRKVPPKVKKSSLF